MVTEVVHSPLWMRRCSFRWCLYLNALPHSVHLNLRLPPDCVMCLCQTRRERRGGGVWWDTAQKHNLWTATQSRHYVINQSGLKAHVYLSRLGGELLKIKKKGYDEAPVCRFAKFGIVLFDNSQKVFKSPILCKIYWTNAFHTLRPPSEHVEGTKKASASSVLNTTEG